MDDDTDRGAATDALLQVSRVVTAVVARTLGDIEDAVSVPQLRVLVMLHPDRPTNLSGIAAGLGVNPSNASRTCDKLEAAGLVVRADDEADRRNVVISLTSGGRRLVDSLMESRRQVFDQLVGTLTRRDQRRLAQGLSAFLAAFEVSGDAEAMGSGAILRWIR